MVKGSVRLPKKFNELSREATVLMDKLQRQQWATDFQDRMARKLIGLPDVSVYANDSTDDDEDSDSSTCWSSSEDGSDYYDSEDSDEDDSGDDDDSSTDSDMGHRSSRSVISMDQLLTQYDRAQQPKSLYAQQQRKLQNNPLHVQQPKKPSPRSSLLVRTESDQDFGIPASLLKRNGGNIVHIGQMQGAQAPGMRKVASGNDLIGLGSEKKPSKLIASTLQKVDSHKKKKTPGEVAKSPVDHYFELLGTLGYGPNVEALAQDDPKVEAFFQSDYAINAALDAEMVSAIRQHDLEAVRTLHQDKGVSLNASSAFGESLVHICARRGTPEILKYFLKHVSPRIRCDYGRTPLHDAAWSTEAKALELMKLLLQSCPDLLLVKDKRGFTPLHYIPRNRWTHCCAFLDKHQDLLSPKELLVKGE